MLDSSGQPFKDHFSGHAASYAASRPYYPAELFSHLAGLCAERTRAWDCATGNGQAAHSLTRHFDAVVASDASTEQILAAPLHPQIEYRVAPAENSGLDADSVDLITVAQALHWFDIERFFAEVNNVLRPGGILAYWCYGLCSVERGCDEILRSMYEFVDEHWPAERIIVEQGYRDIEPPLPVVDTPEFPMRAEWSADQLLDYIRTWSACQRFKRSVGKDPLEDFAESLRERWGPGARTVHWPLYLTVGQAPDR